MPGALGSSCLVTAFLTQEWNARYPDEEIPQHVIDESGAGALARGW